MTDVTQILSQIEQGDPTATEQLLSLVYDDLRKLAAAKLTHEKPGQTLQGTALVHEAYLRLAGENRQQPWRGRRQFFAAASEINLLLVANKVSELGNGSGHGVSRTAFLLPPSLVVARRLLPPMTKNKNPHEDGLAGCLVGADAPQATRLRGCMAKPLGPGKAIETTLTMSATAFPQFAE